MHTLDLLIPLKNEGEYLAELLVDLQRLMIPPNFTVRFIFSDNCSSDKSLDMLEEVNLQNKIIFTQESDTGGVNNFLFLLKQVNSEYFMFVDGHDRLSVNYILDFATQLKNNYPAEFIYIGHVLPLTENNEKFKLSEKQKRYNFNSKPIIRKLQFIFFVYHNSIWHSIFPTKSININELLKSRIFSFDHVLTYNGLAKHNLKYLENSQYVRRYRKVLGGDFSHTVGNRIVSRTERASGLNQLPLNDEKLGYFISNLEKREGNLILSYIYRYFIQAKLQKKGFNFLIFKLFRFLLGRLLRLNPLI